MLIGAGEIIDHTLDLYRTKFKTFASLFIVPLIPSVIIAVAETFLIAALPDRPALVMLLSFLLFIPVYVLSLYVAIAMTRAAAAFITGESPSPAVLLRGAVPTIVPAFVTSVVTSIVIVAGLVAFIIPGIIFAVWFAFAIVFTVLDGLRWRAALSASRALTAGRWAAVFWRLAAPNVFWQLATGVITYAVILVVNGTSGTWSIALEPSSPIWLQATANGLSAAIQGVAAPLFLISVVILFLDLKRETQKSESPNERAALR